MNARYRASPSAIDNWIYCRDNDYKSIDEWVAELQRDFQPTPAMMQGTAFHRLMEMQRPPRPEECVVTVSEKGVSETFRFDPDDILGAWAALPPPEERMCELWGRLELPTARYGTVRMRGLCDIWHGSDIYDIKTTGRRPSVGAVDKYEASAQWRAYLLMFGARRFIYAPYYLWTDKGSGLIRAERIEPTPLCRYEGIDRDLAAAAEEFLAAVESVGMLHLFQLQQEAA